MECVGCADRSCFDLTQHSKATKVELNAKEDLAQPVSSPLTNIHITMAIDLDSTHC